LVDELQNVVQAALPKPLPSSVQPTTLDTPVDDVLSFTGGDATITPDLGIIQSSIYAISKFGDNEDSIHSLVDALVLTPMKAVADRANCSFQWNRNGADSSGATVKNLRPDVLVWLPSGVLVFKGEDKAHASDRILARQELMSKLNCFSDAFFGSVPYQICYAVGGNYLEFVVIARGGGNATMTDLTSPVDLSTVRGRSLCVRYAVNIARVLVSLQKSYPEGNVLKLGARIKTASSDVYILGAFVKKKTSAHSGETVLTELYSQIE
jgi:hypothetical protein